MLRFAQHDSLKVYQVETISFLLFPTVLVVYYTNLSTFISKKPGKFANLSKYLSFFDFFPKKMVDNEHSCRYNSIPIDIVRIYLYNENIEEMPICLKSGS